jgi:hypothetical protein
MANPDIGVLEKAGRLHLFRHRRGYQSGVHWLEHGNLSPEPGSHDVCRST